MQQNQPNLAINPEKFTIAELTAEINRLDEIITGYLEKAEKAENNQYKWSALDSKRLNHHRETKKAHEKAIRAKQSH